MKSTVLLLFLVLLLIGGMGCQEDETLADDDFLAQVLGKGIDCGDTHLVQILSDSTLIHDITGSYDRIYYADNLPEEHKQADLLLKIQFRNLTNEEVYICTTLGIPYRHIYILNSKEL